MVSPARDTALEVLLAVSERDAYANLALDAALSGSNLSSRDAALATELAYGTLRASGTLDWVLSRFANRPIEQLAPAVRELLRMGAYQVLYLQVADHAAVSEAVDAARARENEGAASFTNAVLRAMIRGREDIPWPPREADLAEHIAINHWHPRWIVDKWMDELGPQDTEALCRADNEAPPLTVRVNVRRTTVTEQLEALGERKVEAEPGRWVNEALRLRRAGSLTALPGYSEGLLYAQDEASMAVAHALDAQAGETIVDLCAAPGGKATHIAELIGGDGRIIAVDNSEKRLGLVAQAASRLGDAIVEGVQADGTVWQPAQPADRVLVDAPCSGLGVLARRAESRWRKRPEDIGELADLQARLLAAAAHMVRPSGVLVYSTCTISRAENQDNVESFLAAHSEFEPSDVAGALGIDAPHGPGWMQFLPHVHGTDGIFIAKMTRTGSG